MLHKRVTIITMPHHGNRELPTSIEHTKHFGITGSFEENFDIELATKQGIGELNKNVQLPGY